MAKKVRLTEEEEIIRILKKEGFKELSGKDLKREPYKSLKKLPACFRK
jgi:hypothetical protein